MLTTPSEHLALQRVAELEGPVQAVEDRLSALGLALHRQDAAAVDREATALHAALASAIHHFSQAARTGGVPLPLRQRLALASGQVAAQREALARATAALDRAMDVLLPELHTPRHAAVYGFDGQSNRNASSGSLLA
jgi:hypothetical protein